MGQSSTKNAISVLRKNSYDLLILQLTSAILEVVGYVNVYKNMTEGQIKMAAKIIAEKFYWLTLDDIQAAFMRGCSGDYGPLKSHLDGMILCEWLGKYEQERIKKVRDEKRAEQTDNNITHVLMHPQIKQITDDVLGKIEARDKLKIKETPVVKRERTTNERFADWCIDEFERRWNLERVFMTTEKTGLTKLTAYGRAFTQSDWLEYKYSQMSRVQEWVKSRRK